MRPKEFSKAYVVRQEAFYKVVETDGSTSPLKTGMLYTGQTVWLPRPDEVTDLGSAHVLAFQDDIGRVSISRNALASKA